eukprot:PhM_4_TR10749/c0_g1_i1/m.2435
MSTEQSSAVGPYTFPWRPRRAFAGVSYTRHAATKPYNNKDGMSTDGGDKVPAPPSTARSASRPTRDETLARMFSKPRPSSARAGSKREDEASPPMSFMASAPTMGTDSVFSGHTNGSKVWNMTFRASRTRYPTAVNVLDTMPSSHSLQSSNSGGAMPSAGEGSATQSFHTPNKAGLSLTNDVFTPAPPPPTSTQKLLANGSSPRVRNMFAAQAAQERRDADNVREAQQFTTEALAISDFVAEEEQIAWQQLCARVDAYASETARRQVAKSFAAEICDLTVLAGLMVA